MDELDDSAAELWGSHTVARGSARLFRFGPLWLHVARMSWEWSCSWWWGPPSEPPTGPVDLDPLSHGPASLERRRFTFGQTADPLTLRPALGDRPFVAVPESPFYVLPSESARAYVGVPLWVQVFVGDPPRRTVDLPAQLPPDTWFGGPTAGTLCYGSRSAMRLSLEGLEQVPHRVVVAVDVTNRSTAPLQVSRLRVPVPALSLWRDPVQGHLRAPVVRYRATSDELASVDVEAPSSDWVPLADARAPDSLADSVSRVFNAFMPRLLR